MCCTWWKCIDVIQCVDVVTKISELCMLSFHLRRVVPKVSRDVPSGFKPPNECSMTVIFYAIVPCDTWEWDDESTIYIRFGHSKFGNWNFDAGPGRKTRYSWYVCVMCCTVHVCTPVRCVLIICTMF